MKPITVRVRDGFSGPFVDVTVELRRAGATYRDQPIYEVLSDGEVIGTVERGTITVERGPRGARYVTSRRESAPRYWFANRSYGLDYPTRLRAVEQVVRSHLRGDTR